MFTPEGISWYNSLLSTRSQTWSVAEFICRIPFSEPRVHQLGLDYQHPDPSMRKTVSFFSLMCGMLLLGYYGRTVWQCGLSIVIVFFYTFTNVYILMLALICFVGWYWMSRWRVGGIEQLFIKKPTHQI